MLDRKLILKRRFRPGLVHTGNLNIISDFNGVVVFDEEHQQDAWKGGLAGFIAERRLPVPIGVIDDCYLHISNVWRTDRFDLFMPGLLSRLQPFLPEELRDIVLFDREVSKYRDTGILELIDMGVITQAPGAREFFEDAHLEGSVVGLNTSNNEALVDEMLWRFFGNDSELLIPKRFRVYKDTLCADGVERRNKPFADSFHYTAELMGVPFESCVVLEDRAQVAGNCIVEGATLRAAGAVVIAPGAHPRKYRKVLRRQWGQRISSIWNLGQLAMDSE